MAQNRYIFHFLGNTPLPEDDLRLIESRSQLVDRSQQSLLVDMVDEEAVQELIGKLPNWTITREVRYPIPSTRPTIRKPPK